jgi:hypothetical protein
MQSTTEHTGLSGVRGGARGSVEGGREDKGVVRLLSGGNRLDGESRVFPLIEARSDTAVVAHLPIRRLPVIPAHLSMGAARKVALLRQTALLLVEREEQIVGTIDERALAADHDLTAVAAAMRPLARFLRPATPVTEARELFIRMRVSILPVIAGGFVLGAVTRGDVDRARVWSNANETLPDY